MGKFKISDVPLFIVGLLAMGAIGMGASNFHLPEPSRPEVGAELVHNDPHCVARGQPIGVVLTNNSQSLVEESSYSITFREKGHSSVYQGVTGVTDVIMKPGESVRLCSDGPHIDRDDTDRDKYEYYITGTKSVAW